jgi:hypothetical protein
MALEYRAKACLGIDPAAEKRERRKQATKPPRKVITFEQAARTVHAQRRGTWSNGKHVDQWINTLRDYAFPTIGTKPVDEVHTPDVLEVLSPIWTAKRDSLGYGNDRSRLPIGADNCSPNALNSWKAWARYVEPTHFSSLRS